ncbi:ABC transporter permease [Phaeobacter gallaeciensis]|uniref:Uncharacterized protein n=1 Tax=Phaeobacter gallaeciensis TaxID=60890 RepID=A0AAC9Z649_9RHOB|nr:ABC transporter permease [Phaeobacter gallaeciensis]AHD08089.1 hypothetical protein Gal_00290 [Phaeobacter gallaeciensis DSM 26640]ATE91355.1 hypothetical protein PhaeoP11_00288 [Phaeobacter gallaeciensis]ATE95631.1 hypothetical protein PhaeoP73_00289 [Phaeobacter gallaeciensis]ATE99970.1 hypothetical protein PhaeoP75_00289 [Phaeobacter gallaeciensis]ATF04403.1 hypothetical protein PhaeoP63_00289 [Phaeobacter gallaeciensis]
MTSIENETPPENDLEAFKPGPPQHRIDDKAAVLEREIQDLKVGFRRERFLYYFIIQGLILGVVGPHLPGAVFGVLIVFCLLFSIGLAKFLDFPWIVLHLERWEQLLYDGAKKRILGPPESEVTTEPLDNGDENV